MQTYDIVMLAVLGGTTLFGSMRGIARQIASLISIPLCVTCAYRFHDKVEPMLKGSVTNDALRPYAAMLVVYIGVSFTFWFAFRFVSRSINQTQMSGFDRQMGALLGAAKGALLCTVITYFSVALTETSRAAVLNSNSGKYIASVLHEAKPIIHDKWDKDYGWIIDKLENNLDPTKERAGIDLARLSQLAQQQQQALAGNGLLQQQLSQPGMTDEMMRIWQSLNGNAQATPQTPNQNPNYPAYGYQPNTYSQPGYQPNPYQPNGYQANPYQPQSYAPPYAPPQYGQPYAQPYAPQPSPGYGQPYANPYAQPYAPQQPYYNPAQPQGMNPYAAGS